MFGKNLFEQLRTIVRLYKDFVSCWKRRPLKWSFHGGSRNDKLTFWSCKWLVAFIYDDAEKRVMRCIAKSDKYTFEKWI